MGGEENSEDGWENFTRSRDRELCQLILDVAAIVLLCQGTLGEYGCAHGFYWEGPDMNELGNGVLIHPPMISKYIARNK